MPLDNGVPAGGQGGLTPEALAAIQKLTAQGTLNQASSALDPNSAVRPGEMATAPAPTPAPAGGGGGILQMLLGRFLGGTSAQQLSNGSQSGGALTPEELQRQRQGLFGQPR